MKKGQKKNYGLVKMIAVLVVIFGLIATTFNSIKNNLNLGLDLKGGFEILYEVTPLNEGQAVDMTAVTNSISKRVNVLGVSEPQIVVEGDNRVRVQLAGVADQQSARQMLGTTANLTFRDVDDNLLSDASIITEGGASLNYQDGRPIVSLKIKDQAKFAEMTRTISQKTNGQNVMIIWLDYSDGDHYVDELAKERSGQEPKYISAASVRSEINGDCIIEGNFTEKEARTLADLINSGSLPVKLTEISSNVVSAAYGAGALKSTSLAGVIGIIAVMIYMAIVYRVPSIISNIMLCAYIWSIFFVYSLMGAVLTLPGIAALVLGVGMTVDANIITYERIRQELYKGKRLLSAVESGKKLSFTSIFDTQITTLLAGIIMYWKGNGSVRGFATMLVITVVMTMILNVLLSRYLLDLLVGSGLLHDNPKLIGVKPNQIPDVSKGEKQFYFGFRDFDFLKHSKIAFVVSGAILVLSLVLGGFNTVKGNGFVNLGIDFSSGTKLTVTSDHPITIAEVFNEMTQVGFSNFSYQKAGETTVYATTKQSLTTDELSTIKAHFETVYGQEPGDNVVTPVVGKELVRNAVILTIVAWIAMLAYISFRFKFDYAVSCLIALIHDVLMVLSIFTIFRLEVNTELISVLLTIIGYSINNSIVAFDRVREVLGDNEMAHKPEYYKELCNKALSYTFRMSIHSSVTTILPLIFLIGMGSNAIFSFTFSMLVGMIAGTYSSFFIAPKIWYWLRINHKKPVKKTKKPAKKEQLDEFTIPGINA